MMKTLLILLITTLISSTLYARTSSNDISALMAKVKETRKVMRSNLHTKMRMARQSQHMHIKPHSGGFKGMRNKAHKKRLKERIRLHR